MELVCDVAENLARSVLAAALYDRRGAKAEETPEQIAANRYIRDPVARLAASPTWRFPVSMPWGYLYADSVVEQVTPIFHPNILQLSMKTSLEDSLDAISDEMVQFSVETSPKGGLDIKIGSYTKHVPQYSSVRDRLVQMVLFASKSFVDFYKLVASKSFAHFYESGCISAKPKLQSTNTGSACKDVHHLTDTEPESFCITPYVQKNILVTEHEERDRSQGVDLTNAPLYFRGITMNDVNHIPNLTRPASAPDSADRRIIKAEDKIAATWLIDTAAVHHATGKLALLSGVTNISDDLFIMARDGVHMRVCARGSVITDRVVLHDVWFIPGLTKNVVSVGQLTELDYSVGFIRGTCFITSGTDGTVFGEGRVSEDGLYEMDFLKVGPVI